MEAEIRIVHWYDTEHRRIACGARGQSNSTKHRRGVTCAACRGCIARDSAPSAAEGTAAAWVH